MKARRERCLRVLPGELAPLDACGGANPKAQRFVRRSLHGRRSSGHRAGRDTRPHDVLIIGAGGAGLRAAVACIEAGVPFCFAGSGSGSGAANARNLPSEAARAAAYGLPREIAERLVLALGDAQGLIERAEVAGPGFVNLWLAGGRWHDLLRDPEAVEALRWIGEQYAVRMDQLARLLGSQPGGETRVEGMLSERRTRRVVERWAQARLVETRKILYAEPGWVWLSRAGLRAVGLQVKYLVPRPMWLSHVFWCGEVRRRLEADGDDFDPACKNMDLAVSAAGAIGVVDPVARALVIFEPVDTADHGRFTGSRRTTDNDLFLGPDFQVDILEHMEIVKPFVHTDNFDNRGTCGLLALTAGLFCTHAGSL